MSDIVLDIAEVEILFISNYLVAWLLHELILGEVILGELIVGWLDSEGIESDCV